MMEEVGEDVWANFEITSKRYLNQDKYNSLLMKALEKQINRIEISIDDLRQ